MDNVDPESKKDSQKGFFGSVFDLISEVIKIFQSNKSVKSIEGILALLGAAGVFQRIRTVWSWFISALSFILVGIDKYIDPAASFLSASFRRYARMVRFFLPLAVLGMIVSFVLIFTSFASAPGWSILLISIVAVLLVIFAFDYIFLMALDDHCVAQQAENGNAPIPHRPVSRQRFSLLLYIAVAMVTLTVASYFFEYHPVKILFSVLGVCALLVVVDLILHHNVAYQYEQNNLVTRRGGMQWYNRTVYYLLPTSLTGIVVAILLIVTSWDRNGWNWRWFSGPVDTINMVLSGPYLLILSVLFGAVLVPILWIAYRLARLSMPDDKKVTFFWYIGKPILNTMFFLLGAIVTLKFYRVISPNAFYSAVLSLVILFIASIAVPQIRTVLKWTTINHAVLERIWCVGFSILIGVLPGKSIYGERAFHNIFYSYLGKPVMENSRARPAGDLNLDYIVDGEDTTDWQAKVDSMSRIDSSYADVNADGLVNLADYRRLCIAVRDSNFSILRFNPANWQLASNNDSGKNNNSQGENNYTENKPSYPSPPKATVQTESLSTPAINQTPTIIVQTQPSPPVPQIQNLQLQGEERPTCATNKTVTYRRLPTSGSGSYPVGVVAAMAGQSGR